MIVMNSRLILEHLTELKEKIQRVEKIMSELAIDGDKENLMELLIACQCKTGRQSEES